MSDDVYETPRAGLTKPEGGIEIKKMYSPTQVAVGTFVGGPLTIAFLMGANFNALGRSDLKTKTWLWVLAGTVLMVTISMFLPSNIGGIPVSGALAVLAYQLTNSKQLSKVDIETAIDYEFQSNWRVFGFSLLAILLVFVFAIMVIVPLDMAGLITI